LGPWGRTWGRARRWRPSRWALLRPSRRVSAVHGLGALCGRAPAAGSADRGLAPSALSGGAPAVSGASRGWGLGVVSGGRLWLSPLLCTTRGRVPGGLSGGRPWSLSSLLLLLQRVFVAVVVVVVADAAVFVVVVVVAVVVVVIVVVVVVGRGGSNRTFWPAMDIVSACGDGSPARRRSRP